MLCAVCCLSLPSFSAWFLVSAVLVGVVVEVVVEVRDDLEVAGFDQAFVRFPASCKNLEPSRAHLGMVVESIVMEEG